MFKPRHSPCASQLRFQPVRADALSEDRTQEAARAPGAGDEDVSGWGQRNGLLRGAGRVGGTAPALASPEVTWKALAGRQRQWPIHAPLPPQLCPLSTFPGISPEQEQTANSMTGPECGTLAVGADGTGVVNAQSRMHVMCYRTAPLKPVEFH